MPEILIVTLIYGVCAWLRERYLFATVLPNWATETVAIFMGLLFGKWWL